MQRGALGVHELRVEAFVFVLLHRAVYIIGFAPAVARGEESLFHIYAVEADYRGSRIVEMQILPAYKLSYAL